MSPPLSLFSLLFIFISFSASPNSAAARSQNAPRDIVRSSCVHASYPNLCLRTLSSYAGPANTPRDLAQAAKKRERVALSDCVEQIYDSVDELSKTLRELKHLREETFRWQMSNAQTWVSAALTNEDTCLDGFHEVESKAKDDVKRKITNVARVTSNALYMINRLDESRGRPKLGH
ncbi:pectinesterase inhibitor 3 [Populus alba x Populus x berolinensis]|uniref:Pectinesterase inhibitor 3 n=1 Tax=Populus alba x Populus x berolinensis TaxID=444605 RepID=A0AAD6QNH5_9ROSI|nr:pectinesterase inhibitor 3 [Populus alba x Populus x berolinensis]